jgi:hypothetical protein
MVGPINIETVSVLKNIKLGTGIRDWMRLENGWRGYVQCRGCSGVYFHKQKTFLTCGLEGDENDEY